MKKITILFLFLLSFSFLFAQKTTFFPISLEKALLNAQKSHLSVRIADQQIQKAQILKKNAFDPANLDVLFESPTGNQMRLGVLQTFALPPVYSAQNQILKQNLAVAQNQKEVSLLSLDYQVKTVFQELFFWKKQEKLFEEKDSIFREILKINTVRWRTGDATRLDMLNAESQVRQIDLAWQEAKVQIQNASYQLGFYLSVRDSLFVPEGEWTKLNAKTLLEKMDSLAMSQNPLIKVQKAQTKGKEWEVKLAKRQSLPSLVTGWLNQGDDKTAVFYRLRFGFSIPIWFWVQKSRVSAAKIDLKTTIDQNSLLQKQLQTEYQKALQNFQLASKNLGYFEQTGLQEADEMNRQALQNYRLGNITYYQYLQNIDFAYQIRQRYLETLRNYNNSVLMLDYLMGNFESF